MALLTYHIHYNYFILQRHLRENMINTIGSVTSIANIFTRIDKNRVFYLWDWISKEFGIEKEIVKRYFTNYKDHF